jgi:ABC-type multidrug transport system ATPase subunit
VIQVTDAEVVVDDITLLPTTSVAVSAGEALIVRGRNGTGKSTLLRVLAGMREPSSGSVRVAGLRVSRRDRSYRRTVAAMIGLPPMAPDLTVRDHLVLVAMTWFDDRDEAAAVAQRVSDSLGLDELGSRFPHELSSGQTQLFGLGLVLARPFDVLILDEPEQRLDPDRLETVIRMLADLRDRGATLVVATHSPTLADSLGDRTISLDRAA